MNGEFSGPVSNPVATLICYLHSRAATRRQRTSLRSWVHPFMDVFGPRERGKKLRRPKPSLAARAEPRPPAAREPAGSTRAASSPKVTLEGVIEADDLPEMHPAQFSPQFGDNCLVGENFSKADRVAEAFSVYPRPYPAVNCADRADTMLSARFVQVLKSVPGRTSPSLADRKRARPFRRHSRPTDRAPCAVRCRESPPCPCDARPRKASRTSAVVR